MKKFWIISAAVFFILIAALISLRFFSGREAEACFEDGTCISLDVMDTPEKRAVGLMFHDRLGDDEGMLFLFEQPGKYSFWMKNVGFAIDIIFIGPDFRVVHIAEDAQPCIETPCEVYGTDEDISYVLEAISGFSAEHKLEIGSLISLDIER